MYRWFFLTDYAWSAHPLNRCFLLKNTKTFWYVPLVNTVNYQSSIEPFSLITVTSLMNTCSISLLSNDRCLLNFLKLTNEYKYCFRVAPSPTSFQITSKKTPTDNHHCWYSYAFDIHDSLKMLRMSWEFLLSPFSWLLMSVKILGKLISEVSLIFKSMLKVIILIFAIKQFEW